MLNNKEFFEKRETQLKLWFWTHLKENFLEVLLSKPYIKKKLELLENEVINGNITPGQASDLIIDDFTFILREKNSSNKIDSKKIMAIVSLLVPHRDETGNLLLPHSPITVSQISRLFSPDFKSDNFQIDILKNWINPKPTDTFKKELELLLESGVNYRLFFKVPNGSKGYSYGLSDNGLKIIKPFHTVLTDTILKTSIDRA
jgi:hypothetical protein